jgi:trehalose-6-phosphate synthase
MVVLSENAGSFEEIGGKGVLRVNPFDVDMQAHVLYAALMMDEDERRHRLATIQAHVREHDVRKWGELQLADLDRVRSRS